VKFLQKVVQDALLHIATSSYPAPNLADADFEQRVEQNALARLRMTSILLQMIRCPLTTGTLFPSSRHLSLAMARAAGAAQHVVELGAGTGPVTAALRDVLPGARITAVELQADLAQRLRIRFPGLDVRQATACSVLDNLRESPSTVVLVSSLPFRSLPAAVCDETIASICQFLKRHPGSHLVQFTYQPREPFRAPAGFGWVRETVIWRNMPPAGVWVLRSVETGAR
jgi:phosphatidylethanolamine/phosphatidyl-N-methylethanolamine N-methyltransferase